MRERCGMHNDYYRGGARKHRVVVLQTAADANCFSSKKSAKKPK